MKTGETMQPPNQTEILERLKLIETMMAEGRRTTERWGWSFLLWGIGPLIAMRWETHWPHAEWAWSVVIILCILVNGIVLKAQKRRRESTTTTMRSIGAVWTCVGVTVLLLAFGAVASGAIEFRLLYAALFALAAVANGSSGLILRWWPQFLAALVWWLASVMAFVVPVGRLQGLAALSLILGNIVFGAWLTYCELRRKDG
jgi:hypothetical protein